MDRLACVSLPELPLQLLKLRDAEASLRPCVVVERDHPNGRVLHVCHRAWGLRIRPGQRYAAALSLCGDLHAGVVSSTEVAAASQRVVEAMRPFSPGIEACARRPGVFYLDASGLHRIYAAPASWLHEILATLDALGLQALAALGYSRFRTWALTRTRNLPQILDDPAAERRAVAPVPLERLDVAAPLLEALQRLGVRTVGDLVTLPPDGLRERLGPEAYQLWREAGDTEQVPIHGIGEPEVACVEIDLDHRENDAMRLLFKLRELAVPLLEKLTRLHQHVAALRFVLTLDDRRVIDHMLRPAVATLDDAILLDLVRLKLERCVLSAGVVRVMLVLTGVPIQTQQPDLFAARARRDPQAAQRAIARLCADLGEQNVGVLQCTDGHLPEARWRMNPARQLPMPNPRSDADGSGLVRRILKRAAVLPPRPRLEPDGWLVAGLEAGPVVRHNGPWLISGGWWVNEVQRDYHYVETRRGDLLWVYYDRRRRSWFLQGRVG